MASFYKGNMIFFIWFNIVNGSVYYPKYSQRIINISVQLLVVVERWKVIGNGCECVPEGY
jgi:hypothetical protein